MQNALDIYAAVILGMAGTFALGGTIIIFYLRYRWKFFKQQEKIQLIEINHQKALLAAAVHTQDEERKRIGRDLHDEIGSMLSTLRLQILNVLPRTEEHIRGNIDNVISRVRDISHQLLPPGIELFGLSDALEELCEHLSQASGIEICYSDNTGSTLHELDSDTALSLFRVIQELLNNTLTHAAATEIKLTMQQNEDILYILYSDNGKGFDPQLASKGMGLYNIKSRLQVINASCKMISSVGNGYSVQIIYPVKQLQWIS